MKDIGKVIRTAIVTALDGNITYNSINVGIFDEAPTEAQTQPYIILSTQTESDASNNARFVTEGSILLDIVTIQGASVTKEIAENISDQILDILQPTVTTTGLTLQTGFSLTYFRKESATYLHATTNTSQMLRKVLRFAFRIQEQ